MDDRDKSQQGAYTHTITCTIVNCIEEICCVSAVKCHFGNLCVCVCGGGSSPLASFVAQLFLFKQYVGDLGDGRDAWVTHSTVRSRNYVQI